MKKKRGNIGKLLIESLTKDQLASLLDVLFSVSDINSYLNKLERADPDVAKTVNKILEIRDEKTDKSLVVRVASDQRIVEDWNSLWRHWDDLVSEVGDEDGRYAAQDEHWEPPYFDGYALANDLDSIAQDILSLIEEVYELVDDPDLFYDAMDEIEENISEYPEWMGVESGEGCTLGSNATLCVLKWLWLSSRNNECPGETFLNRVYEIEKDHDMVDMDDKQCIDFFTELPEPICHEIHMCFKNQHSKYNLENIYSRWHKINHIYDKRFDSSRYLETCRKNLTEKWQYGRPLIEDAMNKGDYKEADLLLMETFSSYLGCKDKRVWYPTDSLLLEERRHFYRDNVDDISGLLGLWAEISKKLGNIKRSAASQLQSVIYHTPEDWDTVIEEYKRVLNPEVKEVIDPLFTKWQDLMAEKSISNFMGSPVFSDTWIHWLIEAELDVPEKRKWFIEKLSTWLAHLKEDANTFVRHWQQLARLTRDLPENDRYEKEYPYLYKTVLPSYSERSQLNKSRCEGLQKMDAGACFSSALEVWKKYLHTIIPDPSHAHNSDYNFHAQWMRALLELNRDTYYEKLAKWREEHKRRRNLWRDMKTQGLPL